MFQLNFVPKEFLSQLNFISIDFFLINLFRINFFRINFSKMFKMKQTLLKYISFNVFYSVWYENAWMWKCVPQSFSPNRYGPILAVWATVCVFAFYFLYCLFSVSLIIIETFKIWHKHSAPIMRDIILKMTDYFLRFRSWPWLNYLEIEI